MRINDYTQTTLGLLLYVLIHFVFSFALIVLGYYAFKYAWMWALVVPFSILTWRINYVLGKTLKHFVY